MPKTRYFVAATSHRYPDTWKQCKELGSWGATKRLKAMERVQPADRMLVWLGRKGFAATATITSAMRPARPEEKIHWAEQGKEFPYRFSLEPDTDYAIPLGLDWNGQPKTTFGIIRTQLWPGFFEIDADQYGEITDNLRRLNDVGPGDIDVKGDGDDQFVTDSDIAPPDTTEQVEERKHNLAQLRLLQIGKAVAGEVMPANNDRNREVAGVKFTDLSLPDYPTTGLSKEAARTIKNIDAIWLDRSQIVAAFEIEMSTSIYSGLLRMADLVAELPYNKIALYIVSDDGRKEQVFRELRRPTFAKLGMPERTKFLAYDRLEKLLNLAQDFGRDLKYTFIDKEAEAIPKG